MTAAQVLSGIAEYWREGAAPIQPGAQLYPDDTTARDAVLNWAERLEAGESPDVKVTAVNGMLRMAKGFGSLTLDLGGEGERDGYVTVTYTVKGKKPEQKALDKAQAFDAMFAFLSGAMEGL